METWSDICPFKKEKLFAAVLVGPLASGDLNCQYRQTCEFPRKMAK